MSWTQRLTTILLHEAVSLYESQRNTNFFDVETVSRQHQRKKVDRDDHRHCVRWTWDENESRIN